MSQKAVVLKPKKETTILHFWASWCAPCRVEMKKMFEFQKRSKKESRELEIVMINIKDRPQLITRLYKALGVSFKTFLDQKGYFSRDLNISALPVTLILDRDFKIVRRINGMNDWEAF